MEISARPCSSANSRSVRQPGHGAVVVDDLGSTPAGLQPGQPGQVHGRLGVPGPAPARRPRRSAAGRCARAGPARRARWRSRRAPGPSWARSAAEMPVVTPSRASTLTVNAVPHALLVLRGHQRQAEPVQVRARCIGTQITPLVCRIVNAISSGVALARGEDDVALVLPVLVVDARPPGGRPRCRRSPARRRPACSRPPAGRQPGHDRAPAVTSFSTYLAIMSASRLTCPRLLTAERGTGQGFRDQADLEPGRARALAAAGIRLAGRRYGQADAVHGDRALLDDVPGRPAGTAIRTTSQSGCGVRAVIVPVPSTWPCTRWPSRRPSKRSGRSRLTGSPGASAAETGAAQRLAHHVGGEHAVAGQAGHGQADAVDRDRVAAGRVGGDPGAADSQPGGAVPASSSATTSPSSSTIPVNTRLLRANRLPGGLRGRTGCAGTAVCPVHRRAAAVRVLPPIRTLTVGPGIPPGQPADGGGRVADCHRRFGVSPTPEHALLLVTIVPCPVFRGHARDRRVAGPGRDGPGQPGQPPGLRRRARVSMVTATSRTIAVTMKVGPALSPIRPRPL